MDTAFLDNPAWYSLCWAHQRHAAGAAGVRRYRRGFAPIAAAERPAAIDGACLAKCFDIGETAFLIDIDPHPARWAGWQVSEGRPHRQFLWQQRPLPAVPDGLRRLGAADAPAMQALVAAAQPGPFAERSHELGTFFGLFDEAGLVAMAGQRFRVPGAREISAVCTRPDQRGRGHATQLLRALLAHAQAAGEQAFLHVAAGNAGAEQLYRSLGFRARRELKLHVLTRLN